MDNAAGFIVVLLIVVLLGAGAYFAYDYLKYKKTMESQWDTVQTNITTQQKALTDEQKKRLSNMKYVVDQINATNDDIYNTFTSNVEDTRAANDALNLRQTSLLNGLASVMRGTQVTGGTTSNIDLLSLPGAPQANLELLRRVITVNGMNINELRSDNTTQFCGPSLNGAARCIQLPNANGDTVLTNLVNNKSIVMDATTKFTSNVSLNSINGAYITGESTTRPLTLRSNKFVQIGNQLNLGDTTDALSATAPTSYLSIKTETTQPGRSAVQISTPTASNVLQVDAAGKLKIQGDRHAIYQDSDLKLRVDATDGMVIQATGAPGSTPTITITGSQVNLTGNVDISGQLRVGGKAVAVQA